MEYLFEVLKEKNIEYAESDLLDNREQIEFRLKSELLGVFKSYKTKAKVLIEADKQIKKTIKVLEENSNMQDLLKSLETINKSEEG